MEVWRKICPDARKEIMSEQKINIFGSLFFIITLLILFFLAFFSESKIDDEKVEEIKIEGNYLLDQNDYLTFVRLKNKRDYNGIKLFVIKDRFQKHPYIEKADVKFEGKNRVKVYLTEKKMLALIIEDFENYCISGNRQVFPVLPHTKFIELPVVTNSAFIREKGKDNYGDLAEAVKIINAAELTNSKLLQDLSEINLRNGGDVILTLNGVRPPVIFGRGEEARKMIYLEAILENQFQKEQLNITGNYLDLRFSNRVFIGNTGNSGIYSGIEKAGSYQ
jgi:cell division protein FtsQ